MRIAGTIEEQSRPDVGCHHTSKSKSHALEVACMPHLLQYFFPLLLLHTFDRVIDDCILLAALVHSRMLAGTQHLENAEHSKH